MLAAIQSTCLQDMFDFDNMGFTNTVEHIKFLSCGDCEVMFWKTSFMVFTCNGQVGPLGYHNLQTKKSYLALARWFYCILYLFKIEVMFL